MPARRDLREESHVVQPLTVQFALDGKEAGRGLCLDVEQHTEVFELVVGTFRQPPLPHDERRLGNGQQILHKFLYIRILQLVLT